MAYPRVGTGWMGRKGFHPPEHLIGPLRRFWALGEERIILASALMRHLRKRINAQRLRLSTCKAGALPTELRPLVLMSINMLGQTRKSTGVRTILSLGVAQRLTQRLLRLASPDRRLTLLGDKRSRATQCGPD